MSVKGRRSPWRVVGCRFDGTHLELSKHEDEESARRQLQIFLSGELEGYSSIDVEYRESEFQMRNRKLAETARGIPQR